MTGDVPRIDRCQSCGLELSRWRDQPRCNHPSGVHMSSSNAGGVVMVQNTAQHAAHQSAVNRAARLRMIEGGADG